MAQQNITLGGFSPTVAPKITKAPDFKIVYSNVVRSGVSPWDIRLVFGQIGESDEQIPVAEDLVTVVMSPPQAKSVLQILGGIIQSYEAIFGEIKDLMPILDQAKAEQAKQT
jgi:hypothetical protein